MIPKVPMQLLTSSDETSATLNIMGDISRGNFFFEKTETDTDATDVAKALSALPKSVGEITVHINSYGGEVAEGVAIYNALRSHPAKVTTVCEGFACSIASVIFMAGERRVMRPASLLMLHNASMPANGDANVHRKAAEALDTITELSRTAYMEHATDALTPEILAKSMDDETWLSPATAIEWGLATEVDEPEATEEATQSALPQVVQRLTATPMQVTLTPTELVQVVGEILEKASKLSVPEQKSDKDEDKDEEKPSKDEDTEDTDKDEDEDEKDESDEPKRKGANQRYAHIFQQIANQ